MCIQLKWRPSGLGLGQSQQVKLIEVQLGSQDSAGIQRGRRGGQPLRAGLGDGAVGRWRRTTHRVVAARAKSRRTTLHQVQGDTTICAAVRHTPGEGPLSVVWWQTAGDWDWVGSIPGWIRLKTGKKTLCVQGWNWGSHNDS